MLNFKAALVSLLLGSSSVALASPSVTFSADAQAGFSFGPTVRDHRTPSSFAMPSRSWDQWIALSAPTALRNGKTVIRPEASRISQLRIDASRGMTYVYRVELRFRDGTSQTLPVNQWLTRASSIQLQVRNQRQLVDSITVIGYASRFASSQLFAQGSRLEQPPVYQPPVAQPPVYQPPVYQPPVAQPPVYQPPVYGQLSLGQDMSFAGTDGRRIFKVGADKGSFNTLRLQGATGSTYIQLVRIEFTDGSEQVLTAVQKTLLPGQIHDISLDGFGARTVSSIWVSTNLDGAAVTSSTGTFNASLL